MMIQSKQKIRKNVRKTIDKIKKSQYNKNEHFFSLYILGGAYDNKFTY